jgi:uncharacterized protein YerC
MAPKKSQQELLVKLLLSVNSKDDMEKLLNEVFSPAEVDRATQRLLTTKALLNRKTYRAIENEIGSSTYVIYRVKRNIVNSKFAIVKGLLESLGELDR